MGRLGARRTIANRHPRRWGWLVSIGVHVALGLGLLLIPLRAPQRDVEEQPIEIVFFTPEEIDELTQPARATVAVETVKPRPVLKQPTPPVRRATTPNPPVEVAHVEPPRETPAAEAGSPVITSDTSATPTRVVARGRFGGGALQVQENREPQPTRRTVKPTGFSRTTPTSSAPASTEKGRVVTAGFTSPSVVVANEPKSHGSGTVSRGAFPGAAPVARSKAPRRRQALKANRPVAILSKPKPTYTSAARDLRVEGEVVLDVTFGNSGELLVHGVAQGLGHGLDEAAIEAAQSIRFQPARQDGQLIDYRTTVRVVFKLA